MVVPDPLWLSEPVPEITKLSVRLSDCQNCSEPLLVIAPVMVVTGLVMMAVVPLPIVPPLVTALVVCALPVDIKRKKAKPLRKQIESENVVAEEDSLGMSSCLKPV